MTPRKPNKKHVDACFKDYENRQVSDNFSKRKSQSRRKGGSKKKPWFDQTGSYEREPIVVSPTSLGVIRSFKSQEDRMRFVKSFTKVKEKVVELKKEGYSWYFDFVEPQIFGFHELPKGHKDEKRFLLLERVFRAPNVAQILGVNLDYAVEENFYSLYGDVLINRLKKRGVNLENASTFNRFRKDVERAYSELRDRLSGVFHDFKPDNYLVLDYRPPTEKEKAAGFDDWKVVLTIVDFVDFRSSWR